MALKNVNLLRLADDEVAQVARELAKRLIRETIEHPSTQYKRIGLLFPTLPLVDDLSGLSLRSFNGAMHAGQNSWRQIAQVSIRDLLDWGNIGVKSAEEILAVAATLSVGSVIRGYSGEPSLEALPTPHQAAGELAASEVSRTTAGEVPMPANAFIDVPLAELVDLAADEALSPRSRLIWDGRYGSGHDAKTLAAIGEDLGLSRERVRQILQQSARSIRHAAQSRPACSALLLDLDGIPTDSRRVDVESCIAVAETELAHLQLADAVTLLLSLMGRNAHPSDVRRNVSKWQRVRRLKEVEESRRKANDVRLQTLITGAFWPSGVAPGWVLPTSRSREVREHEDGIRAGMFSSKIGRQVAYESQAELVFLEMLERSEDVVSYQEQPLAIPYSDGGRERLYYPDVAVSLATGASLLVEIKPRHQMALEQNLLKWRAAVRYAHARGIGFLVTYTRRTLRHFLDYTVDEGFRRTVLESLGETPMTFASYRALFMGKYAVPAWDELTALVIQERLRFELAPFRLSRQRGGLGSSPHGGEAMG